MPGAWVMLLLALLVAVGLAGLLLAGCSGSPGRLGADRRVRLLEPAPGSTVTNPVVIRWSSTIERGGDDERWFVVYVDAAMVPPGTSALVAASEPCDTVQACLDAGAMAGPHVFLTDGTSIDAGVIPTGAGPEHRYTIILVDAQGIREGDVAWNASFRIG